MPQWFTLSRRFWTARTRWRDEIGGRASGGLGGRPQIPGNLRHGLATRRALSMLAGMIHGRLIFASIAGFLCFGSAGCCQKTTYAPTPSPASFTTQNYVLTFRTPPGSFSCLLPASSAGSDHGGIFYLVRPTSCDFATNTVSKDNGQQTPNILVFYNYNVVPVAPDDDPPTVSADLIAKDCRKSSEKLPIALNLLGSPAAGCMQRNQNDIDVIVEALYFQDNPLAGEPPDSRVLIELETTTDRLQKDMQSFKVVAETMRVYATDNRSLQPKRPPCPPTTGW